MALFGGSLLGALLLVATPAVIVTTDRLVEVTAAMADSQLEAGLEGEIRRLYRSGIQETRRYNLREGLQLIRKARALAYRELLHGPLRGPLPRRHFVRIAYVEGQLQQLLLIEDQLKLRADRGGEQAAAVQLRAMLLHNVFLAIRGFTGQLDVAFAERVLLAYREAMVQRSRFNREVQLGMAAMLAERGERTEAKIEFAKLPPSELQGDGLDLAVIYYYLAIGETRAAVLRLLEAARRDTWQHGAREGSSLRASMYRMSDFDRLRAHPRFIEMVTIPEEQSLP
ncbi:MAG: hypothetical protein KAY55_07050 [Deltaproteobacteria bacterium]|nr:hypothetical protein [Deltaproteobacteria bacterium]